jgi:predicted nucleic acid-binding protein
MSEASFSCVVDANVALKLFFEQPGSDRAEALFALLESRPRTRFYVPDFFYAECVSALTLYARQAKVPLQEIRQDLTEMLALSLQALSTAELAVDALDITLKHAISGYDAFYVALAQRLNLPLVTADEKLARTLRNKPFQIQLLSAFHAPPLVEG